jgi:tRNA/rRNA methyltransferase
MFCGTQPETPFAGVGGCGEEMSESKSGPAIVLVNPQMGENIGMVARAMANFGLSDLRLVDPRDGWPNEKALAAASRATSVVEGASVHADLRAALADVAFVYATTARERDGFKPVRGPVEAASALRDRAGRGQKTAILFGREKYGLENDEVSLADEIVTFPVDPAYASLNVAQAVLLMAYEWRKSGDAAIPFSGPQAEPAPKAELHSLLDYAEEALDSRGYFRPPARKAKMVDKIRAVLTRPAFTTGELKVLRGMFTSLDRFSPTLRKGDGSPGDDPRRPAGGRRGIVQDEETQ